MRFVLGLEIYAFADVFDTAYVQKGDLEHFLNRLICLCLLTDTHSIVEKITKASSTHQKRSMVDFTAAGEVYQREEISDIGYVKRSDNPADDLTKIKYAKHCGIFSKPAASVMHWSSG